MTCATQPAAMEPLGQPLMPRSREIPRPGVGQILVKTEACGVCQTELHAAHRDWPLEPPLAFIPGHKAIGVVVAVGADVTRVQEGDRVGVPWFASACGHCEPCLTGWETLCPEAHFPLARTSRAVGGGAHHTRAHGYGRGGGFTEYVVADPNHVAHVPPSLSTRDAAPIICAGVTSYKGVKATRARPGEWVAISGLGSLGHLAVQYAKAMDLRVCAIDRDDGELADAMAVGADAVVNARARDAVLAVKKATAGGAHGVLVTAPSLATFAQGVAMTRKHGTCVLVGLPPGALPVPLVAVAAGGLTVRGSFVGSRQDMVEALAFAAEGKVRADFPREAPAPPDGARRTARAP